MRLLAAGMFVFYVAAILFLSRVSNPLRHRQELRVDESPPSTIQALWAATFLLPNLYPLAVAIVPAWTYGTAASFSFPFDTIVQLAGGALWLVGGALIAWSQRPLGRFMMIQIAVAKDHELVTAGPYARIRHPMYAGVQFMVVGLALLFLSDVLLAFAVLAVVLANYRAGKEERLLASERGFGDAYRAYMARTGRFIPRLRT